MIFGRKGSTDDADTSGGVIDEQVLRAPKALLHDHLDGGLQSLLGPEVGEQAALGHLHGVGEAADGDAPQADLARLRQGYPKHRVPRLVSLAHPPIKARPFESGNTLG